MDPAKLKVVELRAALAERGLDTKGNKPVLVERLRKALEEESQEHEQEKPSVCIENIDDTTLKESYERVIEAPRSSQPPRTPSRPSRSSSMTTPTKISTRNALKTATTPNSSKQPSPSKPQYIEKSRELLTTISESTYEDSVQQEEISKLSPEKYEKEQKDQIASNIQNEDYMSLPEKSQETEAKQINTLEDDRCETSVSQVTEPSEKSSTIEQVDQFSRTLEEHEAKKSSIDEVNQVQLPIAETLVSEIKDVTKLEEVTDIKEDIDVDKAQDDTFEKIEDKILFKEENMEHLEDTCNIKDNIDIPQVEQPTYVIPDQVDRMCDVKLKNEEKTINDYPMQEEKKNISINMEEVHEKTDSSDVLQSKQAVEAKREVTRSNTEVENQKDPKDRKRKRSPSPAEIHEPSPIPDKLENEPDLDTSAMILSWYDSDLNLVIDKEGYFSATPMHDEDFCHMWAGARASYGFVNGKVYYETKITELCLTATTNKEQSHLLRVGWSILSVSMQLGEEEFSYAYTNVGKKGTDKEFINYGLHFGKDDVVGCYIDMTPENSVELFYTLNGKELGSAFSICKQELNNRPLFPHILSKNCTFICNFGQEKAWCEQIPGYTLVGNVDLKDRVAGPRRPENKGDCEIIMMCGLPASGKTTWAKKYAAEHPDKLYNILGLDKLVEKTKDIAFSEEQNSTQQVMDKCNRVLNGLLNVASGRRRNYILDERSNVFSSVRRRKMRNFCGYQRKAVVLVPIEEEYSQRLSTYDVRKCNLDSNLMEMKASFSAPSMGELFNLVEWVGLNEEEGKKLIEKYNKEGLGQQQLAKRPRIDKTEGNKEPRDSRNRDMRDHRDRRNNYQDRGRNPPWRGGNNMGGWRGERPQRGGYMRHSGGYGPPPTPWRVRGRGSAMRGTDRRGSGIDRRSGNDRNRSVSARQGGWGPMSNYQGSQQSGWGQQDNWSSSSQSQVNWNQQGGWGQQQWGGGGGGGGGGSWKGYGQSTYGQTGYNQQQGYGNGNWNSWNQQYYNNQYWSQQQQSGQTTAAGGQAVSKQ